MTNKDLREKIQENYSLNITKIEKVKSAFKITAKEGRYCLKCIKYQYPHFCFIQEVMKHLISNGFTNVPNMLQTYDEKSYISLDDGFGYITEWINSRESNYDNPLELAKVSKKLAELHIASENFTLTREMNPRIGWFSWIKVFSTRNEEILDFKKRISQKAVLDEFDNIYLSAMEKELKRGEKSIEGLKKSKYVDLMKKEVMKRGVCHHDIANHNVLIDKENGIHIIDFDYCILDSHLHDLSSLIIRALKNGKWDNGKCDLIINNYNDFNLVLDEEKDVMKEFIRYPQAFWQLGIQRYWEQQPWPMEKFMSRLKSYIEDCDEREEFLESYFNGGDYY
ncbi:MAG: CotS family spore coat protein [Clostridium sp.]